MLAIVLVVNVVVIVNQLPCSSFNFSSFRPTLFPHSPALPGPREKKRRELLEPGFSGHSMTFKQNVYLWMSAWLMSGLSGVQDADEQQFAARCRRTCRRLDVHLRRLLLSRQWTPIPVTGNRLVAFVLTVTSELTGVLASEGWWEARQPSSKVP